MGAISASSRGCRPHNGPPAEGCAATAAPVIFGDVELTPCTLPRPQYRTLYRTTGQRRVLYIHVLVDPPRLSRYSVVEPKPPISYFVSSSAALRYVDLFHPLHSIRVVAVASLSFSFFIYLRVTIQTRPLPSGLFFSIFDFFLKQGGVIPTAFFMRRLQRGSPLPPSAPQSSTLMGTAPISVHITGQPARHASLRV